MTPNARIQIHINQLDQQLDEKLSLVLTPSLLQTLGGCSFVTNNLKTMQLILLQNRCNGVLKGRHTPDDAVFCNNLEFYLEMATKACMQQSE